MSTVLAILKALAAIPKIGDMIEKIIASFVAQADEARRKRIEGAYVDMAKAKTTEEKDAALDKWFRAGK